MCTLKEEYIDCSEYEDFDVAQHQLQRWFEATYLISGLIPSRKTSALQKYEMSILFP